MTSKPRDLWPAVSPENYIEARKPNGKTARVARSGLSPAWNARCHIQRANRPRSNAHRPQTASLSVLWRGMQCPDRNVGSRVPVGEWGIAGLGYTPFVSPLAFRATRKRQWRSGTEQIANAGGRGSIPPIFLYGVDLINQFATRFVSLSKWRYFIFGGNFIFASKI